jgi:putative transcriptional regulator
MEINHHPDVSTLMSCAAGSQPEAFAAVMASHLSMCPKCSRELRTLDDIGIALFEDLTPAPLTKASPLVAARANEAHEDPACRPHEKGDVPAPLVPLIGTHLARVPWKRMAPGVWHHEITLSKGARGRLLLIKVAPGARVPEHGHSGTELTLLLQGSYRDKFGHFQTGDVADVDEEDEHQPVADPKVGCICLVATEGKARFKSLLARLVQPFIGI